MPQRTAILRGFPALPAMRCDHLDTVAVGPGSGPSGRCRRLCRRSTAPGGCRGSCARGRRRPVGSHVAKCFDMTASGTVIGESHDFRPFAALGGLDREAPLFAPVKEASMKASSSSSFPGACNSFARVCKMPPSLPSRIHCWKRRRQVWCGGYGLGSSRHCAPEPDTHIPLSTALVSVLFLCWHQNGCLPPAHNWHLLLKPRSVLHFRLFSRHIVGHPNMKERLQ